jgi:hypothetical protein
MQNAKDGKKVGRPPKGDRAMTGTERARKSKERKRARRELVERIWVRHLRLKSANCSRAASFGRLSKVGCAQGLLPCPTRAEWDGVGVMRRGCMVS